MAEGPLKGSVLPYRDAWCRNLKVTCRCAIYWHWMYSLKGYRLLWEQKLKFGFHKVWEFLEYLNYWQISKPETAACGKLVFIFFILEPRRSKNVRTALFWVITQPIVVIPIGCPKTSVRKYHHSLRNDPEERSSHLLRGGSLKSRTGKNICCFIYCS